MTGSRWTSLGAIFCLFSVAFGAFAAHGLDRVFVEKYAGLSREVGGQTLPLAAKFLNDFKTGAEYQMYHGCHKLNNDVEHFCLKVFDSVILLSDCLIVSRL